MWEVVSDWESISSIPLADSTVQLLEFTDGCIALVSVGEGFSGESEGEYFNQQKITGSQSSACTQLSMLGEDSLSVCYWRRA